MILAQHIDLLAGAIATNNRLATYFLKDPLTAIQEYNADFAERYNQPAIELTEEERQLVLALPQKAHSILEVYECLAAALDKQKSAATDYSKLAQSSTSLVDNSGQIINEAINNKSSTSAA